MEFKKEMTVIKEDEKIKYVYFVRKCYSEEFECVMYSVGICEGEGKSEIYNFSPSFKEAKALCEYLYNCNATGESIFLLGEEFLDFYHI